MVYRGRRVALDLTRERVRISLDGEAEAPLEVVVQGTKHVLLPGDAEIALNSASAGTETGKS